MWFPQPARCVSNIHTLQITNLVSHHSYNPLSLYSIMAPPRIAVLGATGSTGGGVLKNLLQQDVGINVYVRSKSKLVKMFPSVATDDRVSIFEGSVSDAALMKELLADVGTIVLALGENDNRPGTCVIANASQSIMTALQGSREQNKDFSPPRLILLSSSSWNETFVATQPWILIKIIRLAFYYTYQDLLRGVKVLCSRPDLVRVMLMQPGALVEEEGSGYDLSTELCGVATSYSDLSRAFTEVALEDRYCDVPAILVTSKAGYKFEKYAHIILPKVVKGLAASFIPGFWTVHDFVVSLWKQ